MYHLIEFGNKALALIFAKLRGTYVGSDEVGNKYFELRKKDLWGRNVRTCIYNGMCDPTKVPPVWYAWLHYSKSDVKILKKQYPWMKGNRLCLTGTIHAFNPFKNPWKKRYDSWTPS